MKAKSPEAAFTASGRNIPRCHPDCRACQGTASHGPVTEAGVRPYPLQQGSERRLKSVAPPYPAGPGSQSVTRILWRPSQGTVFFIAFV